MSMRVTDILSHEDISFLAANGISVPTMVNDDPAFYSQFDTMYESIEDLELNQLGKDYESTPAARHANEILNKLAVF